MAKVAKLIETLIYRKPWIINGLRIACRKKNDLYRSFLREITQTSEYRYKTYKIN